MKNRFSQLAWNRPSHSLRTASALGWSLLYSSALLFTAACGFGPAESLTDVDGIEVAVGEASFESEVLQNPEPVLVEFGAEWCRPCREMELVLAHLSLNYEGRLKVAKVDVDESRELLEVYDVSFLPLMILFDDGVEVDRTEGWHSLDDLSRWVDRHLGPAP